MRFVAIRTERQQTLQAEHRVRARLHPCPDSPGAMRYGVRWGVRVVLPAGIAQLRKALPGDSAAAGSGMSVLFVCCANCQKSCRDWMSVSPATTGGFQQSARDDIRIKRLAGDRGMGLVVAVPRWLQWVMADSSGAAGKWRLIWGWFRGSTQAEERRDWASISKRGPLRADADNPWSAAVLNACQNKTGQAQPVVAGVSERRNRNIATVALANIEMPV